MYIKEYVTMRTHELYLHTTMSESYKYNTDQKKVQSQRLLITLFQLYGILKQKC